MSLRGTGMLITVGVILDTMRQIETFLLQRHYDGFLKKGRIRARNPNVAGALGEAGKSVNRKSDHFNESGKRPSG